MAKPKINWEEGTAPDPNKKPKRIPKLHRPVMGKFTPDDGVKIKKGVKRPKPQWEPNAIKVAAPQPKKVIIDNIYDPKSSVLIKPVFISGVSDVSEPVVGPGMYKATRELIEAKTNHPFPFMVALFHTHPGIQVNYDKVIHEGSLLMFVKFTEFEETKLLTKSSGWKESSLPQFIKTTRAVFLYSGKPVIICDTVSLERI